MNVRGKPGPGADPPAGRLSEGDVHVPVGVDSAGGQRAVSWASAAGGQLGTGTGTRTAGVCEASPASAPEHQPRGNRAGSDLSPAPSAASWTAAASGGHQDRPSGQQPAPDLTTQRRRKRSSRGHRDSSPPPPTPGAQRRPRAVQQQGLLLPLQAPQVTEPELLAAAPAGLGPGATAGVFAQAWGPGSQLLPPGIPRVTTAQPGQERKGLCLVPTRRPRRGPCEDPRALAASPRQAWLWARQRELGAAGVGEPGKW